MKVISKHVGACLGDALFLGALHEWLLYPFNMSPVDVSEVAELSRGRAEGVQSASVTEQVSGEAGDDNVLAAAMAGTSDADYELKREGPHHGYVSRSLG